MRQFLSLIILTIGISLNGFGQKSSWKSIDLIDTISGYAYALDKVESYKYGPNNLFDNNLKTTWVTGNSTFYLRLPKNITVLNIFNGYGKSAKLYQQNARVKKLSVGYYLGIQPDGHVSEIAAEYYLFDLQIRKSVEFKDNMNIEHIVLNDSIQENKVIIEKALNEFAEEIGYKVNEVNPIIKIEIIDTYEGIKYDDICISEIFFDDKYITYDSNQEVSDIDSIYINEEENALHALLENGQTVVLYKNSEEDVWLSEISNDKGWVTIMTMPLESRGRGLSKFLLINTNSKTVVNEDLQLSLGFLISDMYLEYQGDELILKCTDASSDEEASVKLIQE